MAAPIAISRRLRDRVARLRFAAPVTCVYNPIRYAWKAHSEYLRRYGAKPREVLLLGMNPGPFGMAQTGVPFGHVGLVRDWLGIRAEVGRPPREHPKRPIQGFDCPKSEVSGARLWGWAKDRYRTPGRFFRRFFVANYCPLVFMEEGGRNRTPDKLPAQEKKMLFEACDEALRKQIVFFQPKIVVGVGAFAAARAEAALAGLGVRVGTVLHPSPASPAANRGWAAAAEAGFERLGVAL